MAKQTRTAASAFVPLPKLHCGETIKKQAEE
jgi:hypothetical protein